MKPVSVGVIGCGKISNAYFQHMAQFPWLRVVACADLNESVAHSKASEWNLRATSVTQLLADEQIELVLNLTIPAAHAEVNRAIIAAGKHVYCEKPFALNATEGRVVLSEARAKGVLVGCAPDTFLGSGGQLARKLIDDGQIGKPVAASAFMAGHGPEGWHPNPGFYYEHGGGPMFDMGPYYLTALVNLIGPVESVAGMAGTGFKQRVATSPTCPGKILPVETPTHITGTMRHTGGAISTVIMSFDVWGCQYDRIEVHGTEGSLIVPDPNMFDGEVRLLRANDRHWRTVQPVHATGQGRGMGVADMARAIRTGRTHRASGDLALHVVEVMEAFEASSNAEKFQPIKTAAHRPAALPAGLREGELD